MKNHLIAGVVLSVFSLGAWAQTTAAGSAQRDVNQETRIENGLKSGELSTREAARLEREESRIDRMQARALKDGKLSDAEKARLDAAQDKASQDIYNAKHNEKQGNPNSASSQRMQADVQRNVNQEQRIENGIKDGSLTNREAAKLERGQARVSKSEAKAGADGHVGAHEQERIQRRENHQSKRIHKEKSDAQERNTP